MVATRTELTAVQWRQLLTRITYKPGWTMDIRSSTHFNREHLRLEILIDTDCSRSGRPLQIAHGYQMPPYICDTSTATAFIRQCILKTEEHEAMEYFKVDGVLVADPHEDDLVMP